MKQAALNNPMKALNRMKIILILLIAISGTVDQFALADQTGQSLSVARPSSTADVLDNEAVIQLKQLGLGDGVIIEKIKTSHSAFDVTVNGLKQLKAAGLSDDVITAMLSTKSTSVTSSTEGAPVLVGKLFDCFGRPLEGVSVAVVNSKFATSTDSQGNYTLGYVPGAIQLSYSKQGYYDGDVSLQIAAPATYPVQDVCLYKLLPSKGIFFVGKNDYVQSFSSIQSKEVQNKATANRGTLGNFMDQNFGSGRQFQYFVAGRPVSIPASGKDLKFVINTPEVIPGGYNVIPRLFRVQAGGLIVRQTANAMGDYHNVGEEVNVGKVVRVNDFRVWSGRLTPGQYAFVMEVNYMGHDQFIAPCFVFSVTFDQDTTTLTSAAGSQESAIRARQASSVLSTNARFNALITSVPGAKLFPFHTAQLKFSYDRVWDAVLKRLSMQHEKIAETDKDHGIVQTDVTSHSFLGLGYYDKYVILLEHTNGITTDLRFVLLRYELGTDKQMVPVGLNVVNPKAHAFVNDVNKLLEAGK
jgi:hypothetical protein